MSGHICGCYWTSPVFVDRWSPPKRHYLPQVHLESHTTLTPVSYTTQLTQTFHNANADSIPQVRYTFPLYDGVAVNGYVISYAGKRLKGTVKQKDAAKKTYQAAVDRGETAGLLESLPAGVFGVTLGNVPARADIVVEITYCGELKHDAGIDGLRYTLPTSIAPRYGDYPGQLMTSSSIATSGIKITVDADMAGSAIRKLMSPSHPISVSMGATSKTENTGATFVPSQASAELALGTAELAADFVVQLLIDDISKPQAILEVHPTIPNQRAIMTTLVPKFTLPSAHPEIVFIADQSGSMGGSKNTALVAALNVFLKSLPVGVRFNICAFGNNFKFLWPKSQPYNEANLNAATQFVNGFTASYGGTEILKPIKEAFKKRLADLPLEVMLLTDGEVWQEDQIFSFLNSEIHEKKTEARVFTLGIGSDVSHTLVEGVARAGNGFSQFVTQNEQTDQKVVRMLKAALYGHTKDYSLEVHYKDSKADSMTDDDEFEMVEKVNDCLHIEEKVTIKPGKTAQTGTAPEKPAMSFFDQSVDLDKTAEVDPTTADRYAHLPTIDSPKLLQAPSAIPPLFPFNRTTVYLLLGPETIQKEISSVTLRATCSAGPLELTIPVHAVETTAVPTIHQLAARKAIQELEENRGWLHTATTTHDKGKAVFIKKRHESRFDELIEREAVRLGERYQVAGKWTSFVAVEDKSDRTGESIPRKTAGDSATLQDSDTGEQKSSTAVDRLNRQAMGYHSGGNSKGGNHALMDPQMQLMLLEQQNKKRLLMARQEQDSPASMPTRRSMGATLTVSRPLSSAQMLPCVSAPVAFADVDADEEEEEEEYNDDDDEDMGFGLIDNPPFQQPMAMPNSFHPPVQQRMSIASSFAAAPRAPPAPTLAFGAPPAVEAKASSGLFGTNAMAAAAPAPHQPPGNMFGAAELKRNQLREIAPSRGGRGGSSGSASTSFLSRSKFRKTASPSAAPPPSAPAPAPAPLPSDPVHALIALQAFSGAWAWKAEVFAVLFATVDTATVMQAQDRKAKDLHVEPEVFATALVVAFLESKAKDRRDVWEMVVEKARTWLEANGKWAAGGMDLEGLVEGMKKGF